MTTGELLKKLKDEETPVSLSTLLRWLDRGYVSRPKRYRHGNKARVWTDEHIKQIQARKREVEEDDGDEPPVAASNRSTKRKK